MFEEEAAQPAPKRLVPPAIDAWGVAELRLYIGELKAEIVRAEAEIDRKQGHRSAAEAFFKLGGTTPSE